MCLQEQKLLHFRVILELRTISHKGKSMTAICVFESSFKPANECSMAEDTAFHSVTAAMAVLQSGGDVQVTWLTFYMLPIIRTRGICTVSFSLTLSMKNKYIYIYDIYHIVVSHQFLSSCGQPNLWYPRLPRWQQPRLLEMKRVNPAAAWDNFCSAWCPSGPQQEVSSPQYHKKTNRFFSTKWSNCFFFKQKVLREDCTLFLKEQIVKTCLPQFENT